MKVHRNKTTAAAAAGANATNSLLNLPNELLLNIVQLLRPVEGILFSYTCCRLRSLVQLSDDPKHRQNRLAASNAKEFLLIDDLQAKLGPEWSYCFHCASAHTRNAFFPEQLATPARKRPCKTVGVVGTPDGGAYTYSEVRSLMGSPDTARKQWLSRGNINPVSRTSQERRELHWVSWRVCRDAEDDPAKAGLYSPSVNYAVGSQRPSSHGPIERWRRRHKWACMLRIIYVYPDITPEEVHAHVAGDTDLRKKRTRHGLEVICPHLLSNSETMLQLSASPNLGRATGQCKDCCTSLELRAHAGALYLIIDRDIGRIDFDDPLKNEKWLAQISMPGSRSHIGAISAADLNPSKYEATRQGLSRAVSETLNRPRHGIASMG